MIFDPQRHHRHSIRLKDYDYSQAGAYFVTLVAHQHQPLFGEIHEGIMNLNAAGKMIESVWSELTVRYPKINIDEFVVMPNHFHGIIVIPSVVAQSNAQVTVGATLVVAPVDAHHDDVGTIHLVAQSDDAGAIQRAGTSPAPTPPSSRVTVGNVVGAFKSITTHEYILGVRIGIFPPFCGKIWQRNYYEHIIHNENELNRICAYIQANPFRWGEDAENPARVKEWKNEYGNLF